MPSLAKQKDDKIPYTDYLDLDKCAANRGKVQRLYGRILSYWQRVLDQYPNNSGLAWVWQAFVQTDDGIFMVVITDKNSEPEIGRNTGDSIEIDAVFAKGYRYTSSKKGTLSVPLLVGRDFKRIRSATYDEAYPLPLVYAMTFITLFMIFGAVAVHYYYKRTDRHVREQRNSLRRKRLERTKRDRAANKATPGKDQAADPKAPEEEPADPKAPEEEPADPKAPEEEPGPGGAEADQPASTP